MSQHIDAHKSYWQSPVPSIESPITKQADYKDVAQGTAKDHQPLLGLWMCLEVVVEWLHSRHGEVFNAVVVGESR